MIFQKSVFFRPKLGGDAAGAGYRRISGGGSPPCRQPPSQPGMYKIKTMINTICNFFMKYKNDRMVKIGIHSLNKNLFLM